MNRDRRKLTSIMRKDMCPDVEEQVQRKSDNGLSAIILCCQRQHIKPKTLEGVNMIKIAHRPNFTEQTLGSPADEVRMLVCRATLTTILQLQHTRCI
jgi:hypothetical protein